jgi:O-antigen/teichoic acid export membrane protein
VKAPVDNGPEPAAAASATVGRVVRNTGAATLAQVANALTGYVLLYLVASLLGRTGVGVLGVVISISLIGQMVATLGIYMYLPRLIAQTPENAARAFGTALGITLVASIAIFGLVNLLILVGLLPRSEAHLAQLGALAIVPGALAEICEGMFVARERIDLTALSNVIEGLARLLVMPVLMLGLGWGLYAAAATWVLGRCVGLVVDLVLLRVRLGVTPELPDLSGVRPMVVAALPLSGALLLFLFFARADVPVLAHIAGSDAAGLLVGGYRPVELAAMLPTSLIVALYPALSRDLRLGGDRARKTMEKILVLAMVLMAGATIGLVFESGLLVRILYPPALSGASQVLSISSWSLIPATIDAATTALLLAQGRYKVALGPILLGVVTLIGLNLVLDPRLGAEGAAIARVAAQSIAAVSKMVLVFRFYTSPYLLGRLAGIAVATAGLSLILWMGASRPLLAIPLGIAAYLVVLAALRVVTLADLKAIGSGFGGRRREQVATGG